MPVVASCLLTFAGLWLYALTKTRHHRQLFGRAPERRQVFRLRAGAIIATVLAPLPWIADRGAPMALVTWFFCAVPLLGLAVAGLFTWLELRRPR